MTTIFGTNYSSTITRRILICAESNISNTPKSKDVNGELCTLVKKFEPSTVHYKDYTPSIEIVNLYLERHNKERRKNSEQRKNFYYD